MARESWAAKEGKEKVMDNKQKTVRFVASDHCASCEGGGAGEQQLAAPTTPVSMVQTLVPHLPGLDKDKIYVISGPFPNYDPVSGPSQMLMATPVSPGATVVAVPVGPPPAPPANTVKAHQRTGSPPPPPRSCPPGATRFPCPPPGPAPVSPHMLHWDASHPAGQTIPLRQPVPPVYYSLPSQSSSGLQSPSSEGSSMSESSSQAGEEESAASPAPVLQHHLPHPAKHLQLQHPGHVHAQPTLDQLRYFQGPPQFCHPHQMGPVFMHHTDHYHHMAQHFNQGYIAQQ